MVHEFTIDCGLWGPIKFIRPIPNSSPWGCFLPVVGTKLQDYFTEVGSDILDRALRKDFIPLMNILKAHPHLISKRVSNHFLCSMNIDKSCPLRNKNCKMWEKAPVCFHMRNFDEGLVEIMTSSIREGVYLIVVL